MAGWFEYHLRGDATYGPWVFNQPGGPLASDLGSSKKTYAEAPAPLTAWRYVNFGTNASNEVVAGDYADPDGDRLSNVEEYAFNTDPLASNVTRSVTASLVTTNGQRFLAMTFPLVTAAIDITYRVEASTDLQTWLTGCTYSGTNRVTATAYTRSSSAPAPVSKPSLCATTLRWAPRYNASFVFVSRNREALQGSTWAGARLRSGALLLAGGATI